MEEIIRGVMEFFTTNLSISLVTLISLMVNGVTIYQWISRKNEIDEKNNQAYEMIRGLALASTRRGAMINRRLKILQDEGKINEESMIFLENMYADTTSNIESLLAAAKALNPKNAKNLPFDGNALLGESIVANYENQIKQQELVNKVRDLSSDNKNSHLNLVNT